MSTLTLTKNPRTLIAAATSNSAGGTTEGTPLDLRTAGGGVLTGKITNGGTGPTAACKLEVLICHSSGSTPSGGAEGSNWKKIYEIGGGVTASTDTRIPGLHIAPGVMHLHVRATGNTGQAVTVEAFFSEVTSVSSA